MLDFILQKQCTVSDSHYDMPLLYNIHGSTLHFGRKEFSIITGFRFGHETLSAYTDCDMTFRNRVFPHKVGLPITNLDLIGVVEDEEFFSKLSDVDAVRLCLLFMLEVIFMGRLLANELDDILFKLIENLEAWNSFPWGEHIWDTLYKELVNVVARHKDEHIQGLLKSRNYVPSYTLSGFVWSFQV